MIIQGFLKVLDNKLIQCEGISGNKAQNQPMSVDVLKTSS